MTVASPAGVLEFRPRYQQCELNARETGKIASALGQLPGAMAGQFHNLDIAPVKQTRHCGIWRLKLPPFRVIFQAAGPRILILELSRRSEHTYEHVDRLVFGRTAGGVRITEMAASGDVQEKPATAGRVPARPAVPAEHQNPLTPFTHAQLAALGATDSVIQSIRHTGPGQELESALASSGLSPQDVELLADAWNDPGRYLGIFDAGRTPSHLDAEIGMDELAQRIVSPESSASVASVATADLASILSASIEDWMWFLHPSQERVVRHAPTGPSRVRGGPGTGKTVAALHRARFLVREHGAQSVLLTTFVRVLPPTWDALLKQFAPAEAHTIETRTVDSIAYEIVAQADGKPQLLMSEQDRLPASEHAVRKSGLRRSASWLLTEIDLVLATRAFGDAGAYRSIRRVGRADAVPPAERNVVLTAYDEYLSFLKRAGHTDFAHLRLRAAELAEHGHGPRYDAVIVDEAQDLTAAHVRLLMAVDERQDHDRMMFVGDGQQSVYPGGFTMRSLGLEVRGRSFILATNWRNTQRIADTAALVLGDQAIEDLEDEGLVRGDQALPRRAGSDPELHIVTSTQGSDEILTSLLTEALVSLQPQDIAVLGRTNKIVRARAEQVCAGAGFGYVRLASLVSDGAAPGRIRAGTFEYAKGLEFKLVVLVGPSPYDWDVRPYWLSEQQDIRDWQASDRRKLFVAMTRARDRLVVIAQRPLTPAIAGAEGRFAEWDWS